MFDPDQSGGPNADQPAAGIAAGAVPRPTPPVTVIERARAWIGWFGPARLAATLGAVALVGLGGFWLVRAPAPPTEATLPVAAAGRLPTSTLPTAASPATSPTSDVTDPGGPDMIVPGVTGTITVHVAGRVAVPGVYELDGTARVHDAIERAGGRAADADLDALNLAQPLGDGQRIYVPAVGEVDPASIPVLSPSMVDDSVDAGGGSVPTGPVDLNRASVDELERLPGVGPATAAAIIDDRDRNGPFSSVDELERVPGIGPAKLAALHDLVTT